MVGFARSAHDLRPARGTLLRHLELLAWALVFRILRLSDLHHFGDHVSAALHLNPIADADSESLDLVRVVQCCFHHGDAADPNRLKICGGSQLACASNRNPNVPDARPRAARRPFVSDGPSLSASGEG